MRALKISEDLLPLSELKSRASEVVDRAEQTGRPVVLTRHGRGVAVLLSVEAFEDLQVESAKLRLWSALKEAEAAVQRGEVLEHGEVDRMLKAWEEDEED